MHSKIRKIICNNSHKFLTKDPLKMLGVLAKGCRIGPDLSPLPPSNQPKINEMKVIFLPK